MFRRIVAAVLMIMMSLTCVFSFAQSSKEDNKKPAQPLSLADYFKRFDNVHIRPYAYILSGSVWPTKKIYVCWLDPLEMDERAREIVRQAVTETWQGNSALVFAGWQPCAAQSEGIRIRIRDIGPHTLGLGKQLDGVDGGMVLNFTFKKWGNTCAIPGQRDICIRSIAIHEFGHAIGFAHEQSRPDTPGECSKLAQGPKGDKILTPYDPDSALNYCKSMYKKDFGLSKLDIEAVQVLYGPPLIKTMGGS